MSTETLIHKLKKHSIKDIPRLFKANYDHYIRHDLPYYLYDKIPFGYAPAPRSINIKITNRCNLNCVMCGQTATRHQKWQQEELSADDWIDFLRSAAHFNPYISFWGGEPLMFDGIIDIFREIHRLGLQTGIITNGLLLEKYAPDLASFDNLHIGISLDGPPEIHDEVRCRKGTFQKMEDGLNAVNHFRKKYGKQPKQLSVIFSTITPKNQYHFPELIDTARRFNPEEMCISYLTFVTNELIAGTNRITEEQLNTRFDSLEGFKADITQYDVPHIEKLTEMIRNNEFNVPFKLHFNPVLNPDEVKRYYFDMRFTMGRKTCFRPWFIAELLPNGQLNFCPDFPDYRFGDIRTTPFLKIWNGTEARAFRKLLKKFKLLPMCVRCCGLLTHQPRSVLRH
ncbi:MAG: radical SAM protein [Candidatus Auribacterota bacterium]